MPIVDVEAIIIYTRNINIGSTCVAIKNPQLKTNLKNIILLKDMHKTLWPEVILVKKMEKKIYQKL